MKRVTLYTRVDCSLCDKAKVALDRVRERIPFELEIIDIDSDPGLIKLYDWEVPVVMLDGRKVAKLTLDESMLERRLRKGETP